MSSKKVALISGVSGQDGAYLAQFLLKKGYEVHGIKRRSSSFNTQRVDHIYEDVNNPAAKFRLHYGDMTDSTNAIRIIQEVQPDEIYNLAAQSHVQVSFETPEYTFNADAGGPLRMLEAIRVLKMEKKTKFYQASTSEMFGKVQEVPQKETTPFYPRSPYGVAKLYGHWITKNYREAYDIFGCSGILFNHESPLRGETFVTRKITMGAARIKLEVDDCLYLGNLDAKRDWGHAREYVQGMWMMLQHSVADDYVLATGKMTSVRDFLSMSFKFLDMELEFRGSGENEYAVDKATGKTVVKVEPRYFRPTEVDELLGDPSKAQATLGWQAKIDVESLCKEMVLADYYRCERDLQRRKHPSVASLVGDSSFLDWYGKKVIEAP